MSIAIVVLFVVAILVIIISVAVIVVIMCFHIIITARGTLIKLIETIRPRTRAAAVDGANIEKEARRPWVADERFVGDITG